MRGFCPASSRDSNVVVDDVTTDIISEVDQLSTEDENVCVNLEGTSGGVASIIGDGCPRRSRSIFLGVEGTGCVPSLNPPALKDDDAAEK